ncbi:helix-turn-helix domain-containing protein [Epilithonimonas hominis]|uniref:DNA-binding protein n=1 Tax=Epilithonimonas hominis TaxID=420404 RepID=A0A3N0XBE5_9FLAO|nr:helix-turn-helix domain-containing protein [Epilithonimonas hominis]ROI14618.1 DNA-binding protein [Epilithonimonas hominis]
MHNLVLSPIDPEILINSIVDKVTANILTAVTNKQTKADVDELLTVQEAAELLKLSRPTIYSKVSRRELPCMKQGKRLYFSQTELLNYIKEGKKKTFAEIEAEADAYLSNNKKGLNNGI